MKPARRLALLAVALLGACTQAPPWPGAEVPAPPAGRWEAPKRSVLLGEAIEVRLHVVVAGEAERRAAERALARWPLEGGRLEPLGPWRSHRIPQGLHLVRRYRLVWLRPGRRVLPARALGRDEDAVAELSFDVKSGLPESRPGPAELPAELVRDPPPRFPWLLAGALAAVVLAGSAFAAFARRRRRAVAPPPPPPEPPARLALRRLKRLRAALDEGWIGGEELAVELTEVLRVFLERGLGLPSIAKTSEELLAEIAADPELAARVPELRAFLATCDLVKFAGRDADLPTCRRLLEVAEEVVRSQRARADERGAAEGTDA